MHTLIRDQKKCVNCGNCEYLLTPVGEQAKLPGGFNFVRQQHHRWQISDISYYANLITINQAIAQCYVEALTVEECPVYEYKCQRSSCLTMFSAQGNGGPMARCPDCGEQTGRRVA